MLQIKNLKCALLAITLTFCSIFITQSASASGDTCQNVKTNMDFQYCLLNAEDITVTSDIDMSGSPSLIYNKPGKSIIIDLGNHIIYGTPTGTNSPILAIVAGQVTIQNGGIGFLSSATPISIYGSENANDVSYTTVNIEPDVYLKPNTDYAIKISANNANRAYAINLNFNGHITGAKGIYVSEDIKGRTNYPSIHIGDSSSIVVDDGYAILAGGFAGWNILSATLSGTSGIGIKQGNFYVENSTITATGSNVENPVPIDSGYGMPDTGAAIQIEDIYGKTDKSDFVVENSTFTSTHGYAISEYAKDAPGSTISLQNFEIRTGIFNGTTEFEDSVLNTLTGGIPFYFGNGWLAANGSAFLEVDELYDSHKMTVYRFANNISGIEEIYADPRFEHIERLLPVYMPLDDLYYDEEEALQNSKYQNSTIFKVFDLTLRMFEYDTSGPMPGTSRPYTFVTDTTSEFPITLTMPIPEIESPQDGYIREYYVLNFHYNIETGEIDIEKLPAVISEDKTELTFSTHKFSSFAFAYEDKLPEPEEPEEPEKPIEPEQENPDIPDTGTFTKNESVRLTNNYILISLASFVILLTTFIYAKHRD